MKFCMVTIHCRFFFPSAILRPVCKTQSTLEWHSFWHLFKDVFKHLFRTQWLSERNVEMLTSTAAAGAAIRRVRLVAATECTHRKREENTHTCGGEGARIQPHTSIHLMHFLSNSILEDIPIMDHTCLRAAFEERSCFLYSPSSALQKSAPTSHQWVLRPRRHEWFTVLLQVRTFYILSVQLHFSRTSYAWRPYIRAQKYPSYLLRFLFTYQSISIDCWRIPIH